MELVTKLSLYFFESQDNQWILCLTLVNVSDIKKLENVACWFLAMLRKFLRPSHPDHYSQDESQSFNPETAPSFWGDPWRHSMLQIREHSPIAYNRPRDSLFLFVYFLCLGLLSLLLYIFRRY